MKIYLDNDVFSMLEKQDNPTEEAAMDAILEQFDADMFQLVTSQVTKKEIARLKNYPERKKNYTTLARMYRLLEKVPFVEDQKLLGFHSQWSRLGGYSYPMIEDDEIWKRLIELGVDKTDAHHLMLAIRAKCDVFLTCDGGMLDRRSQIEREFTIKVVRPTEFISTSA